MEVTCCSTYWDLLRCTLYSLSQRREILLRLAIPIVYGAYSSGHHFIGLGWIAYPLAALFWTFGVGLVLGITLNILIFCRLAIPRAKRVCTTTLTPEGFTDVTLRKTQSIPWSIVSDIRYHQGDIFFWRKGKDGIFVPQSAFRNSQQSHEFYQCALSLWNAAKEGRGIAPMQDAAVWPPAPRLEIDDRKYR